MSKKAEIKTIVLDLGGKEIKLSLAQAKQLNLVLGELFDLKPLGVPYYPIVIERHRPYWEYEAQVWTSGGFQMSYTAENQTMSLSL